MKSKLQTALKSNVDPFFFVLACVLLLSISFTARALANDLLVAVSGSLDNLMMAADGQLIWTE